MSVCVSIEIYLLEDCFCEYNALLQNKIHQGEGHLPFSAANGVKSRSVSGKSTLVESLERNRDSWLNLFKWITKTLGNFWIEKLFVHFLRALHLAQVWNQIRKFHETL